MGGSVPFLPFFFFFFFLYNGSTHEAAVLSRKQKTDEHADRLPSSFPGRGTFTTHWPRVL